MQGVNEEKKICHRLQSWNSTLVRTVTERHVRVSAHVTAAGAGVVIEDKGGFCFYFQCFTEMQNNCKTYDV